MVEEGPSAFRRVVRQYVFTGPTGDPRSFIRKITKEALRILGNERNTRAKFRLLCVMERTSVATNETARDEAVFSSRVEENLEENDEKEIWKEVTSEALEHMAQFQRQGSNWRFVEVIQAELHFVGFDPLRTGKWISLLLLFEIKEP